MFARAVNEDAVIQAALENVILLEIDCEKGEGPEIAAKYGVRGYPSYVTVDAAGEVVGRWIGYEGPEAWSESVASVLKDPRTITAKQAAYEESPTLDLALALAGDASTKMDNAAAVEYFRKARELDPDNAAEYDSSILVGMYYGLRGETFTVDQVVEQAGTVTAGDLDPEERAEVAFMVRQITTDDRPERAVPFIEGALKAIGDPYEEEAKSVQRGLLVERALLVDKDPQKALGIKREGLPAGWDTDPRQLNRFAWWCFENDVNLDEALDLALKGVELAEAPGDQANILDTAAEICHKLGDCGKAVELMQRAVELNPGREYYKNQLARFEEILAEQGKG